jgi:hypothetical protein
MKNLTMRYESYSIAFLGIPGEGRIKAWVSPFCDRRQYVFILTGKDWKPDPVANEGLPRLSALETVRIMQVAAHFFL